ncbi:MAG: iron donor protein CyaY, partial [Proteobacteria bacterium]|nr:iron donor protein CyaY [Pseudomonadota bacterium]
GSQIIFSRQGASREIWVAARSGGFHLRQEADDEDASWRCGTTGESLAELVNRVFTEQSGEPVQVLA